MRTAPLWFGVVLLLSTAALTAQIVVRGGSERSGPGGYPGPPPDPADAVVLSAKAFQNEPVDRRRRIMTAWMAGQPESAGTRLYPMLESGLLDSDVTVQRESIRLLGNMVTRANLARYQKNKTATTASPQTYPAFYAHSLKLLNHTDRDIREAAVSVLASFYHPPRPGLDGTLLTRFAIEPSEKVKAMIVRVLAQHARLGSIKSKQVILTELQGASSLEIRLAAIFTMRILKYDEALPTLVTLLPSTEQPLRMAAAGALESYDSLPAGQVAQVTAAFKAEQDERVRASLGRVLSKAKK